MISKNTPKTRILATLFTTIFISACGGGGSNDSESSNTPNNLIKFTDGDSYTYSSTGNYFNAPPSLPTEPFTHHFTSTMKNPQADFSHDIFETSTPPGLPGLSHINKNNQADNYKSKYLNCEYTNNKERPSFSLQIGETWSKEHRRVCTHVSSTTTSEHTNTGEVIQREPYKTEAGTFSTFKTEMTSKQVSFSATITNKRTCWYDELSAQVVACQGHIKSTSTTDSDSNYERKYSTSLIGINTKNHPVKKNRVERFIGHWDIKISGTGKDNCSILIEATGNASGSCWRDGAGYEMSGAITPEGFIAFVNRSGNFGFAGNFADPTTATGTWKNSWENGTWTGTPISSP